MFDLADEVGITVFGTGAKAISAWEKAGLKPRETHDLAPLRAMLSTGSVLAPESFEAIGARARVLGMADMDYARAAEAYAEAARLGADAGARVELGVGQTLVLELDRRDPLSTRLDDILASVGDLRVAARVDEAHVARP